MTGADGDTSRETMSSESRTPDSLDVFRERLAEAIAWCARRGEGGAPAASLRSLVLAPPPAQGWAETCAAVIDQRHLLLGRSWRRTLDPLGGGQLIRYRPTPPHSGGDARRASEDYFDERDAPPWDTWVCYVEQGETSYIVAWVPPGALASVTAGLKAGQQALSWTTLEAR